MPAKRTISFFDYIIIGSSPLLLLEAIKLSKKGDSILMIERGKELGGAWVNSPLLGLEEVEVTCHLLESYKGVYNFLEEEFNIEFREMTPMPRKYYNQWVNIDYNSVINPLYDELIKVIAIVKQSVFSFLYFFFDQKKAHLEFVKIKRNIESFEGGSTRIFNSLSKRHPILYFAKGSGDFLRKLVLSLDNVILEKGMEVEKIEIKKSHIELTTGKGLFHSNNIIISQGVKVQQIVKGENVLGFIPIKKERQHVHVLVEGLARKYFSYLEFRYNPIYHRVSDITEYTQGIKKGKRLLLFELRATRLNEEDQTRAYIYALLNRLKKYNILSKELKVNIVDYNFSVFQYYTYERSCLEKLAQLDSANFRILKSKGDLTKSIVNTYLQLD